MDIRFVSHENTNPSKHLNRSEPHPNHLGTPISTVNFFNVLMIYLKTSKKVHEVKIFLYVKLCT